jgi:hypothetical protein
MNKNKAPDIQFKVSCTDAKSKENIAIGLMRLAVMITDGELTHLKGGILIQPVPGGVKLISDIVLLEGDKN